jgi:hypothetical protein
MASMVYFWDARSRASHVESICDKEKMSNRAFQPSDPDSTPNLRNDCTVSADLSPGHFPLVVADIEHQSGPRSRCKIVRRSKTVVVRGKGINLKCIDKTCNFAMINLDRSESLVFGHK